MLLPRSEASKSRLNDVSRRTLKVVMVTWQADLYVKYEEEQTRGRSGKSTGAAGHDSTVVSSTCEARHLM